MIRKHTDEELKKIAVDLHSGLIFSDRHCNNPSDVTMVFMILHFMDKEQIEKFKKDKPAMIYEYLSEAVPRICFNGMPSFFSMRIMNKTDFDVMWVYYEKLVEAVKNL